MSPYYLNNLQLNFPTIQHEFQRMVSLELIIYFVCVWKQTGDLIYCNAKFLKLNLCNTTTSNRRLHHHSSK